MWRNVVTLWDVPDEAGGIILNVRKSVAELLRTAKEKKVAKRRKLQ